MKKVLLIIVFISVFVSAYCADFSEMKRYQNTKVNNYFREINYLPAQAWDLNSKFGIRTILILDTSPFEFDVSKRAMTYFRAHFPENIKGDYILIFVSEFNKKGKILLSGSLSEKTLNYKNIIERDILNKHIFKWYTSDSEIIGKVFGSFLYLEKKDSLTKEEKYKNRGYLVEIDNPLFLLSMKQPFYDIVRLFYLEPITFILYFPFITYFIFVRGIGTLAGTRFFLTMQAFWAVLNIAIIGMVISRLAVIFPGYAGAFTFVSMFNLPIYMWMYYVFSDNVNYTLNRYLYNVTGGFDNSNLFEGKKWEEDF